MQTLRTPDDCFENLSGYPFTPNYSAIDDGNDGTLRIHYVDAGPRAADPVLMLHGEPSWSYLYRHMIPIFAAAGYRAVAPDLVGFGRSDKPTEQRDYTFQRHVDWMTRWLNAVGLHEITLVCQDWGALIGLRLAAEHPDRFARIVLANGGLPTGDQQMPDAFKEWQQFSQRVPVFDVGRIINGGCVSDLNEDVIAGYNAPFPDESYKAGARIFPMLVPTTPDDPSAPANRAAWQVLMQWEKPFLTAFSDGDPITAGGDRFFQENVPGAKGQPHTTIQGGGHFLQEDKGTVLAEVVARFMKSA